MPGSRPSQSPYLTVAETASELEISRSGVYKLVARGKLPAVRRSERGMRIPLPALDAYRRRLAGHQPRLSVERQTSSLEELRAAFEVETGLSPAAWERRWRSQEIEDSAENMQLAVRALTLLVREQEERNTEGSPSYRGADRRAETQLSAARG